MGNRPQVVDWFEQVTPQKMRLDLSGVCGDWTVLAWFNWKDRESYIALSPADFNLAESEYWVSSFWNDQAFQDPSSVVWPGAGLLWKGSLAAHGALLLAVRRVNREEPAYLGSDIHISQGLEVTCWEKHPHEIKLVVNTKINGVVNLFVRGNVTQIRVEEKESLNWKSNAQNIIRFEINPEHSNREIIIQYQ
jgi:hypothetical protein